MKAREPYDPDSASINRIFRRNKVSSLDEADRKAFNSIRRDDDPIGPGAGAETRQVPAGGA